MSTRYDIYLSSTLKDLVEEREAVQEVLRDAGFSVKQSYSASEDNLVESCLADVSQCRVYIGVIGMRYGYRPVGADGVPADKSITQMEFELAFSKNIPCFVFMKAENAAYTALDFDSHSGENEAGKLIAVFRARLNAGAELRPDTFKATSQLREKVAVKIADLRGHVEGGHGLMESHRRNIAELTHDVALLLIPGTDEPVASRLGRFCTDKRFQLLRASPTDTAYHRTVDTETRACRTVSWVLSAKSLGRFQEHPDVLAGAIDAQRFRNRSVFALLVEGAGRDQLHKSWKFDDVVDSAVSASEEEALDALYSTIRASSPHIYPDRRIGIPSIVLALTEDEAVQLADDPDSVLKAFKNEEERNNWARQLDRLHRATRALHEEWPGGFYGAAREDWRPFGEPSPTAEQLLTGALARINDDAQRSSRERLLLAGESVKLQLRRYSFDEYLTDRHGSRDNLDAVRDRGCLVLVDELALLHPKMRPLADAFLVGPRVAVVSANPCDPAALSVPALLSDLSFLRVGNLRERFQRQHDPRCELAVNSVERMQRWLRLVLPELVPALGSLEPQLDLRDKMFAPKN